MASIERVYKKPLTFSYYPSSGRVRLRKSLDERFYALHLLYAPPVNRGNVCLLEDFPPLFNTEVTVAVPEKVKLVGEALGVCFCGCEDAEAIGEKTAAAIRELMKACGIPSIAEKGFSREETIAAAAIAWESPLRFTCPVEVKEEALPAMFAAIYDNY